MIALCAVLGIFSLLVMIRVNLNFMNLTRNLLSVIMTLMIHLFFSSELDYYAEELNDKFDKRTFSYPCLPLKTWCIVCRFNLLDSKCGDYETLYNIDAKFF